MLSTLCSSSCREGRGHKSLPLAEICVLWLWFYWWSNYSFVLEFGAMSPGCRGWHRASTLIFPHSFFLCCRVYSSFARPSGALTRMDQSAGKFSTGLRKRGSSFGKAEELQAKFSISRPSCLEELTPLAGWCGHCTSPTLPSPHCCLRFVFIIFFAFLLINI